MESFKDVQISKKVKVTCKSCLKENHKDCTPLSPIKKVTCLCAFFGHKDRGTDGKVER